MNSKHLESILFNNYFLNYYSVPDNVLSAGNESTINIDNDLCPNEACVVTNEYNSMDIFTYVSHQNWSCLQNFVHIFTFHLFRA